MKSEHVEGGDVGVLAEAASLVASVGKGDSPKSMSKNPKIMSPSKISDIGGLNSAHVGQVSPSLSFSMNSIAEPYNPTKLLISNVHGTVLDPAY